jgi:peptidoglycan/LPS O-acetylase OafA/YrhL
MNAPKASGSSGLFRIAGLGASVAFGAMVGSLFAVKSGPEGLTFELNVATIVAFLVAGMFAWFYWRMVERMAADKAPQRRRKKFIVFSVGLLLVGVVSFLYPLKFIPPEKRWDVFVGLSLAVLCVSGVGAVMWKVKRFLDADEKRTEEARDDD